MLFSDDLTLNQGESIFAIIPKKYLEFH